MDTDVVVALIAASAAVVTSFGTVLWSVWSHRQGLIHQRQLQADLDLAARERDALKAKLDLARDAAASRRAYEYEGLQRLYDRYEPLRFQLMEAVLHAGWRVQSLARSARLGDIAPSGEGWLAQIDGYYLAIAVYELMLPAALFRLMKRQLTFVDFSLDPRIAWEYRLAKGYYLGPSNDFSLAALPKALPYEPDVADWRERRRDSPARHWRQGASIGILDSFLDQLIRRGPDGAWEVVPFGEFYDRVGADPADEGAPRDALRDRYRQIADVFVGFHPETRPVLWRVLLYQVVFAYAFHASGRARTAGEALDASVPDLPEALVGKYQVGDLEATKATLALVTERARKETSYAFSL